MRVLSKYVDLVNASMKKEHARFTPAAFTNFVRKIINDPGVKFKTKRSPAAELNTILVSGLYDPEEDQENFPSIEITLHFNPAQPAVKLIELNYTKAFLEICEIIRHEVCHQAQYRSRKWRVPVPFNSSHEDPDIRDEQEYLGTADEIEAYSISIASEILIKNQFVVPKAVIKEINTTSMFKLYEEAFGKKHQIVAQVKECTLRYLRHFKGT